MAPVLALCALLAAVPSVDEMRGPFPIMSTPYFEDGRVDYEGLKREADWLVRCGTPGAIWCQSNDAIDLLTTEEKFRGFEACSAASRSAPSSSRPTARTRRRRRPSGCWCGSRSGIPRSSAT